jgi:DNA-binding NarL/FixJ family response regulator
MPEVSGVEALRAIKKDLPNSKIVMLTVSEGDQDLVAAAQAGADGYLLKNLDGEEFLEMLAGLNRGEAAMTRKTAARLLRKMSASDSEPTPSGDLLTEREIELLQRVAAGLSNREAAQELSISENTVKYHMKNILQKLGVSNRTEAATVGLQRGLIEPGDPSSSGAHISGS